MEDKNTIDNIIDKINYIYKAKTPLNYGEFKVGWIDEIIIDEKLLVFNFIYSYPGKEDLYIIRKKYTVNNNSDMGMMYKYYYESCLIELLKYILFAKDSTNLTNNNGKLLVIKSIQTLIRENE